MNDVLDVDLRDAAMIAEIDLATELMVAAARSTGRLDQVVIDTVLGVRP